MPLSTVEFGVRRSARYVSMGRRRPLAIPGQRKGQTHAAGEERRFTKQKLAWSRESWCLKWWVEVRVGVNQSPSHVTTLEGWKRWLASSIGAAEGGVRGHGFSSVLVRYWVPRRKCLCLSLLLL